LDTEALDRAIKEIEQRLAQTAPGSGKP
jgi:hypothetical protein